MSVTDAIVKVASSIAEAGPKTLEALNKLFPGIAERSKANAASHGVRTMADDVKAMMALADQSGMSQEMALSLVNAAYERHGSDQRVAECFMFAIDQIEEDGDPYGVDEEWIDYWRVHASKAHEESVQAIWGAILAGEINNPGAVSKHSMSILADMSKFDAETLKGLVSFFVLMGPDEDSMRGFPFLVLDEDGKTYNGGEVSYAGLVSLDALGVLRLGDRGAALETRLYFWIDGEYYIAERADSSANWVALDYGRAGFTNFGAELARFACSDSHPRIREIVESELHQRGFVLSPAIAE